MPKVKKSFPNFPKICRGFSVRKKEFRSCGSDQDAVLDLPPFEKGGPKLCAPAALERQAAVGAEGTAKGSIKKWFF